MSAPVERLTMVYDADGGLRGELAYAVRRARGDHCTLCDITHGTLREKPSFAELRCSLGIPVDVVHRNEQGSAIAAFTASTTGGQGACVVAHTADGLELLLDDADLAACRGDVDELAARLDAALSGRVGSA
jgi:hypothetical protein